MTLVQVPFILHSKVEVCQEIKSNKSFQDTVIIMFTVKVFDSDRKRGFQAGADYYVESLIRCIKNRSYFKGRV